MHSRFVNVAGLAVCLQSRHLFHCSLMFCFMSFLSMVVMKWYFSVIMHMRISKIGVAVYIYFL